MLLCIRRGGPPDYRQNVGVFLVEAVEGGANALVRLVGDGLEFGSLGDLDHDLEIQGVHEGRAGVAAHDHVAGQQPDLRLDLEGLVGELGLQVPRITYGSLAWPSFCLRVACTSISVRVPNP